MRRTKINEADVISMPLKVLTDQRLKPTDKLLISIIPYLPSDRTDTRTVGARTLAPLLSVTGYAVARSIERLDKAGYIEIKERRQGNGGGFRVLLKRTGLVGLMVATLGAGSALHNLLRADELRPRGKVTELHIIRQNLNDVPRNGLELAGRRPPAASKPTERLSIRFRRDPRFQAHCC